MGKKTITFKLIRDCAEQVLRIEWPCVPDFTYVVDMPRVDLNKWQLARIEITISEDDEEP